MRDLTGLQIGRLKVIAKSAIRGNGGQIKWVCECECGNTVNVMGARLTHKTRPTQSCGCLHREKVAEMGRANRTHGLSDTPTWHSWYQMVQRCTVPTNKSYVDYGARGITVCPQWVDDYEQFLSDMGLKPTDDYTIERVDNDKGYSPDNCVWATRAEQNANTQRTRWFIIGGEKKSLTQLAKENNILYGTLERRINRYGMSIEEALARG